MTFRPIPRDWTTIGSRSRGAEAWDTVGDPPINPAIVQAHRIAGHCEARIVPEGATELLQVRAPTDGP